MGAGSSKQNKELQAPIVISVVNDEEPEAAYVPATQDINNLAY